MKTLFATLLLTLFFTIGCEKNDDTLAAPKNVQATVTSYDEYGPGQNYPRVKVDWEDVTDNEDGFVIFYKRVTESGWEELITLPANETSWNPTNWTFAVGPPADFVFAVRAFSNKTESKYAVSNPVYLSNE